MRGILANSKRSSGTQVDTVEATVKKLAGFNI